jgi:SAM-dependent methyltransferase
VTDEFTDPRLVAIFDSVNAYEPDAQPGFYAALAAELGARRIVDLGCGSGLITCALARQGYEMIGVEPAPLMLERARQRPDGPRVRWIDGDASALGTPDADLAIMTGHVAQFFLTDDAWYDALTALHRALRPGRHLAFETRNPNAREWERWAIDRHVTVSDPIAGEVETWTDVTDVDNEIVSYNLHYRFVSTGEELIAPSQLRFRTESELTESLNDAGFTIDKLYGDWDRRRATPTTRELIVVAQR